METTLVKLKSEFNHIINIRNNVKNVFDTLQVRIDRLSQIYSEFIKTNKNEMFVFGLDTFHFQSKLIDIEYDDMKRLFLAINNRMYCEYFKLHKIIIEYISKSVTDKKVTELVKINNYPIYKDLEPFKEYKFEIILDLHENILNLLAILMSFLNNKENELTIHKTKLNIGLNIDNFITSFNFNISVMREKIYMFITYIEFFHKMHSKYLKRFSNKIQLMYTHISNDIKFDDSVEISKNKKKELIDEFLTDNMDKKLIKELKTSIGSETNSETSSKSNSSTPSSKMLDSLVSLNLSSQQKKEDKNSVIGVGDNIIQSYNNKERKNYKNIFQRNINKVTNILKISKPSNYEGNVPTKLSDKDIEEFLCDIDESCDLIINKPENTFLETQNINLNISTDDSEEQSNYFIPIDYEEELNNKLTVEGQEEQEKEQLVVEETNDKSEIEEQLVVEEESNNKSEVEEQHVVEEPNNKLEVEEQEEGVVKEQEQSIETEKVEESIYQEVISVEEPEVKENNVTLIETHEPVKKKCKYKKKK